MYITNSRIEKATGSGPLWSGDLAMFGVFCFGFVIILILDNVWGLLLWILHDWISGNVLGLWLRVAENHVRIVLAQREA